jgi:hypothetical protein
MFERRSFFAASLLLIAIAFVGSYAHANGLYPAMVQQALNVPCPLQCTLCHNTTNGGPGDIRKPGFGNSLELNFDLSGSQTGTLAPALQAAEAAMPPLDTDGDGVPDITELRAGEDPNVANGPPLCGSGSDQGPTYGCVRVAPTGSVDGVATIAGIGTLLIGLSVLRRKRARTSARTP